MEADREEKLDKALEVAFYAGLEDVRDAASLMRSAATLLGEHVQYASLSERLEVAAVIRNLAGLIHQLNHLYPPREWEIDLEPDSTDFGPRPRGSAPLAGSYLDDLREVRDSLALLRAASALLRLEYHWWPHFWSVPGAPVTHGKILPLINRLSDCYRLYRYKTQYGLGPDPWDLD
jgi:hypothetical protein